MTERLSEFENPPFVACSVARGSFCVHEQTPVFFTRIAHTMFYKQASPIPGTRQTNVPTFGSSQPFQIEIVHFRWLVEVASIVLLSHLGLCGSLRPAGGQITQSSRKVAILLPTWALTIDKNLQPLPGRLPGGVASKSVLGEVSTGKGCYCNSP